MHGVGHRPVFEALTAAGFSLDEFIPVKEQKEPDPDFPTVPFPNPEEKGEWMQYGSLWVGSSYVRHRCFGKDFSAEIYRFHIFSRLWLLRRLKHQMPTMCSLKTQTLIASQQQSAGKQSFLLRIRAPI